MTNNELGTIKAEHKTEIEAVFGERGTEIAAELEANPQATMLGILFKNFSKKQLIGLDKIAD